MAKEDIKRFYVGELNFIFNDYDLNKDDVSAKNQLYNYSLSMGAIPLKDMKRVNNRTYKCVYTLFYKMDDGKYLCLHNNEVYGLGGEDLIYELTSFEEFLPKIDYYHSSKISFRDALILFDKIVNNKRINYSYIARDIKKYFLGTMEICDEIVAYQNMYPYCKENYNVNMIEHVPLRNLYLRDGQSRLIDNKTHNLKVFKSIFYLINDDTLYNLNNHILYSINNMNTPNRTITLNKNMQDVFNRYRIGDSDVTIGKVLKLEKKLLKDVDF